MLFVIDQSIADLFGSGTAIDADAEGLNNLALGAAEGSHRIIGTRATLLALARQERLYDKTRRVLERAARRVSGEMDLFRQLTVYGKIVASNGAGITSTLVGRQRVLTFSPRWFDRSAKVQPTHLLGEHLDDAHVLYRMGEAAATLRGLGYLPISHRPDHGGGSTIGLVLASHAAGNQLCLCVVDSDRGCPAGNMGGTAASVQAYKDQVAYPLIEVVETSGRDLENALPDVFYRTRYQNAAPTAVFEQLTALGETELRAHLDVERGLMLSDVFQHANGSAEAIFWRNKVQTLWTLNSVDPAGISCWQSGACVMAPQPRCFGSCILIQRQSSNVLRNFISLYKDWSRYDLAGILDASIEKEWQRLGSEVASWCCGDDRMRI